MRARFLLSGLVLATLPGALAACGPRESAAQIATDNACEQQANALYDEQHREWFIRSDQSMSPMSSTGLADDPSQGLGQLYVHDQEVDNCESRRASSTMGGTTIGPNGRE